MKKGFTLIELLAVIVILAIIALIATPIVLSIINDTRESSTLRNAEYYLDAVEQSIMKKNINTGGNFNPNICIIQENGDLLCDGKDELIVDVKGTKPSNGTITFDKGNMTNISLELSDKVIVKNENGELVYEDNSNAVKLCTATTKQVKALVWQGNDDPLQVTSYAEEDVGLLASSGHAYEKGVSYTCDFGETEDSKNLTFFVLSETEDMVTLILGANLGEIVDWSVDGNNHKDETEDKQAVTAKAAIAERTSNWSSKNGGKLNNKQMSTIKLPTKDQIEDAYTGTMPTWLYSYAKSPNTNNLPQIAYGYWTSTPIAETFDSAWAVICDGNVGNNGSVGVGGFGVRPVITLSKSDI